MCLPASFFNKVINFWYLLAVSIIPVAAGRQLNLAVGNSNCGFYTWKNIAFTPHVLTTLDSSFLTHASMAPSNELACHS